MCVLTLLCKLAIMKTCGVTPMQQHFHPASSLLPYTAPRKRKAEEKEERGGNSHLSCCGVSLQWVGNGRCTQGAVPLAREKPAGVYSHCFQLWAFLEKSQLEKVCWFMGCSLCLLPCGQVYCLHIGTTHAHTALLLPWKGDSLTENIGLVSGYSTWGSSPLFPIRFDGGLIQPQVSVSCPLTAVRGAMHML